MSAIPLGDAAALERSARITRLARWVSAAVLVCAALLALLAASRLRPGTGSSLPATSTGIVVLDVSASISSDTYDRIASTLDRLARSRRSYGLILFSDTAYQALPPGSNAEALRPFVRFFRVPKASSPGALPQPPRSPWTTAFSGGTRISTGLALALDVIRDQRLPNPAVMLVSDLDDDTADVEQVSRLAVAYRRGGIGLHVVGLNPSPEDEAFIRRLVPTNGSFVRASLPGERSTSTIVSRPVRFVLLVVVVAFALAAFAVASRPLAWRPA